jgi:hypothetical protein
MVAAGVNGRAEGGQQRLRLWDVEVVRQTEEDEERRDLGGETGIAQRWRSVGRQLFGPIRHKCHVPRIFPFIAVISLASVVRESCE